MSVLENITGAFKNFGPTTWSIKNKASIYLVMLIVSLFGVFQFVTLPKEQFPDIVIPTIYVQTIYVGNSPKDIENLVTRPIEKQIKGITGAKINKTTSIANDSGVARPTISHRVTCSKSPGIAGTKLSPYLQM